MKTTIALGPILSLALTLVLPPRLTAADLGMAAPPLKIDQWIKGKAVDLKEGKDKNIYVVEFWATWCGPCRTSIPHLTEMQKKFKDQNVIFIGVSDETADKVKPFVEKMGEKMDYVVALDQNGKTGAAYMGAFGINGIPHSFVVDKTGAIAWHGHPMSGLDKVIDQLLAGKFDLESFKRTSRMEGSMQQYYTLVTTFARSNKAWELGEQIVTDAAKDPEALNELAWLILTDKKIKTRDLDLALRAAKLAFTGSEGKHPTIADTYALALFENGKAADAVRIQKQAIQIAKDDEQKARFAENLKHYEAKAGK